MILGDGGSMIITVDADNRNNTDITNNNRKGYSNG